MRIGRAGILATLVTAFMVGSLGGAWAAPSPAPSAHPGAAESLTVSVGDTFSFSLSNDEVQPGDTVTITLVELGTTAHTFTLSAVPNFQFNSTDSVAHLNAFFQAHPPLANLWVNGSTGERHTETFTAPAYGEYEYICNQSGHFAAGMWGLLGSGEHGSSATVATGPGWPVFAIGGGIASLVVATIVVAFVVGQRPGGRHEMPPERLGYPEEPAPVSPPPHP